MKRSILTRLEDSLLNRPDNYIFPFFWQHGEDADTLRQYMAAIHGANIGAVCIESRPHADFLGPKWWADLDVILEEAEKRSMRVWILDDQHFPTGYAAGAVEQAPMELCHQYLCRSTLTVCGPIPGSETDVEAYARPQPVPPWFPPQPKPKRIFHDDHLFRVLACPVEAGGAYGSPLDLTDQVRDGQLIWDVPGGMWQLEILYLTRDAKGRNDYINFLDAASCRLLLDTVYEPHYARYGDRFGKVIAGFFSDEPPIGNTPGYTAGDLIGNPTMALAWSAAMPEAMTGEFGPGWEQELAYLWSPCSDAHRTARIRTAYMNAVSKLVSRCFSQQLGDWCQAHGVEYIGHMLEDCDSNANLGPSMGHFFRGLAGQHMAGIDNIGGQVLPGGQNLQRRPGTMCQDDAGFYHYLLGRLGASMAAIDPKKRGRCMCENLGAYGWQLRLGTEKYLMDHFLVRGVNRFVPHAFTPKAFPDPDCPPHFYAHGINPQYRGFGRLMEYTNRLCHLLDGGRADTPVALLYHGESQWAGPFESNILAARALTRSQFGFLVVPDDVFAGAAALTEGGAVLNIHGQSCRALVFSGCAFLPKAAARFAVQAMAFGFPVAFTGRHPQGIADADPAESHALAAALKQAPCVPVEELPALLDRLGVSRTASLDVAFPDLTVYRYENEGTAFVLLNESPDTVCQRQLLLPGVSRAAGYDPWRNRLIPVEQVARPEGCAVTVLLQPYELLVLVADLPEPQTEPVCNREAALDGWTVRLSEAANHPQFGPAEEADLVHGMQRRYPEFSGILRYETTCTVPGTKAAALHLPYVFDGGEVFVDGVSVGMTVSSPGCVELGALAAGTHTLAVEVTTTLERRVHAMGIDLACMNPPAPMSPLGLVGIPKLAWYEAERNGQ